jgi:hypothetical protein
VRAVGAVTVPRGLPAGHPLADSIAMVAQAGSRGPLIPRFGMPDGKGGAPEGDGWVRADEAAAGGVVGGWLEEIRQVSAHGHRQAAAVKLAETLAYALLSFTVQSVFLAGVAPDLSPGNVWLRWRDGKIDGVALAASDVSPPGEDLDEWLAARVAATLGPLLAGIRARSRTGLVTLWGRVADVVHVQMLRAAKDLGYDTRAAWQRAEELTDAISAVVPRLRLRPRPFPVRAVDQAGGDWDGIWPVFGTCCFLYKARPDIRQCNVCPLRSDQGRCFDWPHELPPAPPVAAGQAEAG